MRYHDSFTIWCGEEPLTAENRMDSAKVLTLLAAGRGPFRYLKIACGTPAEAGTALTQTAVAAAEAETVAANYDPARGPLYVTRRAVFGDELAAGTLVGEVGFSDNASLDTDTVNAAAFGGRVAEKRAGEPLTVEGTVFLAPTLAGVALAGGEENGLARYLLGDTARRNGFSVRFYASLPPGVPLDLAAGAAAEEPASVTASGDILATLTKAVRAEGFLLLSEGKAAARDTRRQLAAPRRVSLSGLTEWQSPIEDTAGEFEVAFEGVSPPAGWCSAWVYPTALTACRCGPVLARLAAGDALYTSYAASDWLSAQGGRFCFFRAAGEDLIELAAGSIDISPQDVRDAALSAAGEVFLLLKSAPYLAVFRYDGAGFTRLTVEQPELFAGGSQIALTSALKTVTVKRLVGLRWHVTDYLYAASAATGRVTFTDYYDAEFVDPALHVDEETGCKLIVDVKAKRFSYLNRVGFGMLLHESLRDMALTRREVLADSDYLYVLSPSLTVYELFTGRQVFTTEEEPGLCRRVMSGDKKYFCSVYADGTLAVYAMDRASGRSLLVGRGDAGGKVRDVRFFGSAMLVYTDGGEGRRLFLLHGGRAVYRQRAALPENCAPYARYAPLAKMWTAGTVAGVAVGEDT